MYLRNLITKLEQEFLLASSEWLDVGITTITTANLDLLYLEDVVDRPDDAQQAAHHDYDHLYGIAHG
jgi:hypothetical protein